MGVATPEVGYTPAMPRREDHEVHKDMWGHWTKKKNLVYRDRFAPNQKRNNLRLHRETEWVCSKITVVCFTVEPKNLRRQLRLHRPPTTLRSTRSTAPSQN